jgi:hypothetical protein
MGPRGRPDTKTNWATDLRSKFNSAQDCDPRMTALTRSSSNCELQNSPFVREVTPHQQTRNCLTVIEIWWTRHGCLPPKQHCRLTVARNITLTFRQVSLACEVSRAGLELLTPWTISCVCCRELFEASRLLQLWDGTVRNPGEGKPGSG